jgi:hypothetical protein
VNLVRAATLSVADVDRGIRRYAGFLDHVVIEEGRIASDLAKSWGTPGMTDRRYAVMRPASGLPVDLRLIEAEPCPDYRALRSFGWSALEICVADVHATQARLLDSPFEIIGPPAAIASLPTIHPMQVIGCDDEVVYLTQILQPGPSTGLPFVHAPIDRLFIVVLACADLDITARWCAEQFGIGLGQDLSIPYSMLNRAFDLPMTTLHRLIAADHEGDLFLELDQSPAGTVTRNVWPGQLPPGIALCTFTHPDIDAIPGPWYTPPVVREGAIYEGRRVGVLRSPEGALFEVVDGVTG